MKKKILPLNCPSCSKPLVVTRLRCNACETEVQGSYPLPLLSSLPQQDQEFILQFVKSSGSLKEMAKLMAVSYPTVRNKLNEVIDKLESTAMEEI